MKKIKLPKSLLITGITLSGSFFGFVIQILIARSYGATYEVDAYLYSVSTPLFIAGLIASIYSYSVLPKLISYEDDRKKQDILIYGLLKSGKYLAIIIILIAIIIEPFLIALIPNNSSVLKFSDLKYLIIFSWVYGGAQVYQSCLSNVLHGVRRHALAALLNLGPYLGLLLILALDHKGTILMLPLASACSCIISALIAKTYISIYMYKGSEKRITWSELKTFIYESPYTIISLSCFSAVSIIDAYWASHAISGTLSMLGYAQRIVVGMGNIAIIGPLTIYSPEFSKYYASNKKKEFFIHLIKLGKIVGIIGLFVVLCLYWWLDNILNMIFSCSEFNRNDIKLLVETVDNMLPGMFAMLLANIWLKALFSMKNGAKVAAILGIFWIIIYWIACSITWSYGSSMMAYGYSLSWVLYLIALNFAIFYKLKNDI